MNARVHEYKLVDKAKEKIISAMAVDWKRKCVIFVESVHELRVSAISTRCNYG